MRHRVFFAAFAGGIVLMAAIATSQEAPAGRRGNNPQQRAEATRKFLGLGPEPDKAAAARGGPLFQQNCAFCHGPQARGAEGPSLITSDVVLDDEHGEKLVPFLKAGRPAKGMPSFAAVSDNQLKDIAEFIHLQVEDVANRGTYQIKNIVVGDAAQGKTYLAGHCLSCHKESDFDHIATKFRSPDQLQRTWVWPEQPGDAATAITATVKMPDGGSLEGRVTQISDFRVTLKDDNGQTHVIDREPGVDVQMHDPLSGHEKMLLTLKNSDLHNVTAYLESLK